MQMYRIHIQIFMPKRLLNIGQIPKDSIWFIYGYINFILEFELYKEIAFYFFINENVDR